MGFQPQSMKFWHMQRFQNISCNNAPLNSMPHLAMGGRPPSPSAGCKENLDMIIP